jgi:acyl carrier protein
VRTNTDSIRDILARHGRLPVHTERLADDTGLYAWGLTPLATAGVMLAIEERFDVGFPESKLNRATFRSITAIAFAVSELEAAGSA